MRRKILNEIENIFQGLSLTNKYEDSIDEGITKGYVNWQLFGTRKPGNKAYNMSYYYSTVYNKNEEGWNIRKKLQKMKF